MSACAVASEHARILVIDDEQAIRDATTSFLATCGFEVDSACEREEAEALLSVTDYALVIADMRMTGVHGREGLELLTHLRERRPGTRAVILTAYGSEDLRREILRRGADAFLQKPIPLRDLALVCCALVKSPAA